MHAHSAQGERERRAPYGTRLNAFSGELSAIEPCEMRGNSLGNEPGRREDSRGRIQRQARPSTEFISIGRERIQEGN